MRLHEQNRNPEVTVLAEGHINNPGAHFFVFLLYKFEDTLIMPYCMREQPYRRYQCLYNSILMADTNRVDGMLFRNYSPLLPCLHNQILAGCDIGIGKPSPIEGRSD